LVSDDEDFESDVDLVSGDDFESEDFVSEDDVEESDDFESPFDSFDSDEDADVPALTAELELRLSVL
jgi:hypothetical protein